MADKRRHNNDSRGSAPPSHCVNERESYRQGEQSERRQQEAQGREAREQQIEGGKHASWHADEHHLRKQTLWDGPDEAERCDHKYADKPGR
jgi:hypothetical protein